MGIEVVYIKDNIDFQYEKFVLAHELGHALLHVEIYEATFNYEKISVKTKQSYETAWNHLSKLKDTKVKDIKKSHIEGIVDSMDSKGLSYSSTHKGKVLAKMLFGYALADDIVDKNYANLVGLPSERKKEKEIFGDFA